MRDWEDLQRFRPQRWQAATQLYTLSGQRNPLSSFNAACGIRGAIGHYFTVRRGAAVRRDNQDTGIPETRSARPSANWP